MKFHGIESELTPGGDRRIGQSVPDTFHDPPLGWGEYVRMGRSSSLGHCASLAASIVNYSTRSLTRRFAGLTARPKRQIAEVSLGLRSQRAEVSVDNDLVWDILIDGGSPTPFSLLWPGAYRKPPFCISPSYIHKRARGWIPKAARRLLAKADVHCSDRERQPLGRELNSRCKLLKMGKLPFSTARDYETLRHRRPQLCNQ